MLRKSSTACLLILTLFDQYSSSIIWIKVATIPKNCSFAKRKREREQFHASWKDSWKKLINISHSSVIR